MLSVIYDEVVKFHVESQRLKTRKVPRLLTRLIPAYSHPVAKVSAKKVIETLLRGEAQRRSVTLYMDWDLWVEFKQSCREVTPSRVIEGYMRDFVESARREGASTPKPKKKPK